MSDLVFPSLPGVSIEVSRSPVWESALQRSVSGCAVAITAYTFPLWKYRLRFELLRSGAEAELQQIAGFFNKHHGRVDTWRFFDEEDCTAIDQPFGAGDGVNRDFYLVRDFGGFVEPVRDVQAISVLKEAGVSTGAYTNLGSGHIQMAVAPAAGHVLTWSGTYYRRCRFDLDMLDLERFLYQLWKARTVQFSTEKGRG